MMRRNKIPRILSPRTVNEALEMAETEPNAAFWGGGTTFSILENESYMLNLPQAIIKLSQIEELSRASRTEQSLEIGSMVTLDKLAHIKRNTLPPGFQKAILGIGTRPLRCRSTIGGNVIQSQYIGDLRPLLQILDAKVEIRYRRKKYRKLLPLHASKKIPIATFSDPENNYIQNKTLVTRFSIPTIPWDHGQFVKIQPSTDETRTFIFCALARIDNNALLEFRMVLTNTHYGVQRNIEFEGAMAGCPLPLSAKDSQILISSVNKMTESWENHEYERNITIKLIQNFFMEASAKMHITP